MYNFPQLIWCKLETPTYTEMQNMQNWPKLRKSVWHCNKFLDEKKIKQNLEIGRRKICWTWHKISRLISQQEKGCKKEQFCISLVLSVILQ